MGTSWEIRMEIHMEITEKNRLTSVGSGIWQFGDEGLTSKEQYLQCGSPQL